MRKTSRYSHFENEPDVELVSYKNHELPDISLLLINYQNYELKKGHQRFYH